MVQSATGGGGGAPSYFSGGTSTPTFYKSNPAPAAQPKKAAPKKKAPKPVYAPAPPPPPRAPSGGGGVRPTGGVGSNSSGRISTKAPPPPAKPAAPALTPAQKAAQDQKYLLTDTAYQTQNNLLTKAAKDYLTQKTSQENTYNTQYGTNLSELEKQQGVDYGNTEADYAARGMGAGSGSAQKALADLLNQYKTRKGQLLTDKNTYLGGLGSAYTNFQGEQTAAQDRYKLEALARRAAAMGM
jgi:hypothetical protein